ncbi:unnamed protein product, partial [Mesorhabditis spiculigera]
MPSCGAEHLTMNFCGTVISCNPADAQKYSGRPAMNTTTQSCCYITQIKDHGDCDTRETVDNTEPVVVMERQPVDRVVCESDGGWVGWAVSSVLLVVIIIETAYLLHALLHRPLHSKISSHTHNHPYISSPSSSIPFPHRPLIHKNRPLLAEP